MTEDRPYRLIWFHHFHKAGGTTMCASAEENGEKLYPLHRNGNPYTSNDRIIPLWDFGDREITEFIDHCEAEGITFVSTEWGCPDLRRLKEDPRVLTVTFVREPYSRLISNYEYDILNGYAEPTPIGEYYFHHSLGFRQPDYYVRALARGTGLSKVVSAAAQKAAVENYRAVDCAVRLGHSEDFDTLTNLLGWPGLARRQNVKRKLPHRILRNLYKGYFSRLRSDVMLETSYRRYYQAFRPVFDQSNARDLAFYAQVEAGFEHASQMTQAG